LCAESIFVQIRKKTQKNLNIKKLYWR